MKNEQRVMALMGALLAEGVTTHQIDAAVNAALDVRLGESITAKTAKTDDPAIRDFLLAQSSRLWRNL